MCVASTAKRRRRQAKNGFKHLPPMARPHYPTHSDAVWTARAAAAAERRRVMETRKSRKKAG